MGDQEFRRSANLVLMSRPGPTLSIPAGPFSGVRRMTLALHDQGWPVNHKRTRRLMRLMGLEAVYPRPRLSSNGGAHLRFPYLLKGLLIEHRNQVWCSDITYIGLAEGFVYLFALMDCSEEVYLREHDSVTEACGVSVATSPSTTISGRTAVLPIGRLLPYITESLQNSDKR